MTDDPYAAESEIYPAYQVDDLYAEIQRSFDEIARNQLAFAEAQRDFDDVSYGHHVAAFTPAMSMALTEAYTEHYLRR
jgi:hypothetical protein